MKRTLQFIIAAAILTLAGCDEFTTSYERIDGSEFRLLDFLYLPADASPGDTITLMAVFAGKKVDLDSYIDWWISFNVITDIFGGTTVVDSVRLENAAWRVDTSFSPNTQTVAWRIPIPKDIVRKSASIPDRWTDIFPPSVLSFIPEQARSLSKNDMISLIEDGQLVNARLLQLFTVPIRITAKIREEGQRPHTIVSSHSIRYNRRLSSMGYRVPINSNPDEIIVVSVYKVSGKNRTAFDPWYDYDKVEAVYQLYINPGSRYVRYDGDGWEGRDSVIVVEDGFTYFVDAFVSSSRDFIISMDGNLLWEYYTYNWQYAHDPEETAGIRHSKFMDIGGLMEIGPTQVLTPPADKRISKFTIWLTVREDVMNERLRPEGSALVEMTGRFVYE
ncbi:MAG: hypothetical protein FWB85_11035 [Chitinispirillia bacterium]|nr:hypothetical protein [Chitinispirillia bacterium]MCL2242683.1 hypothetical protein [Chitinispirillia bacterium]